MLFNHGLHLRDAKAGASVCHQSRLLVDGDDCCGSADRLTAY